MCEFSVFKAHPPPNVEKCSEILKCTQCDRGTRKFRTWALHWSIFGDSARFAVGLGALYFLSGNPVTAEFQRDVKTGHHTHGWLTG
jgi:hypothetical protein